MTAGPCIERLPSPHRHDDRPVRLGVVSFLNTLPLIDGLEGLADVDLRTSVPSLLIDQLGNDEVDLALCSSIDYQRRDDLAIIPVGMLGCHGPTLTVRLYASQPIDQLERVYCDTDSHTSVALLRVILAERYGVTPEIIAYHAREHVAENRPIDWPPAMLLIGDKVVTDSPPAVRYPHQLDLGAAWAEWTGLPFVFAVWMARRGTDRHRLATAAAVLDRQRRHNRQRLDGMIARQAGPRRWPRDMAGEYLRNTLHYNFTDTHRRSLELFFDHAAAAAGVIDRARPIELLI